MEKEKLVHLENEQIVVSSRQVADSFGKEHRNLIRDIETLIGGMLKIEHTPKLFEKQEYTHPQNGQKYNEYIMNRDGFSLLVMGFTGEKALEWKLKYIQAFNLMEEELRRTKKKKLLEEHRKSIRGQDLLVRQQNARVRESNQYLKIAAKIKNPELQYVLYAKAAEALNDGIPVLPSKMPKVQEEENIPIPSKTNDAVENKNAVEVQEPVSVLPSVPSHPTTQAPPKRPEPRKTYSATEIGKILGGINSSRIGKIANDNHLKTAQYGRNFYSRLNNGQEVHSWRYYDSVIPVLKDLLKDEIARKMARKNRQTTLWSPAMQNSEFDLI